MELTKASFEPLVGDEFEVPHPENGEVFTCLTLQKVEDIHNPNPARAEPFSAIFHGPRSRALAQGAFMLRHSSLGEQFIFLVPIGESGDIREYQAIFN